MAVVAFATFKELVGRKLGILAVGGSLSAEDGDLIGEAAETLQEQVSDKGIVSVDFESGVDSKYSDVLADLTAAVLVDHYGVPEPRASVMRASTFGNVPPGPAERRLRKLATDETIPLATVTDFTIGY